MTLFYNPIFLLLIVGLKICNPKLIRHNERVLNQEEKSHHSNLPNANHFKECLKFSPLNSLDGRSEYVKFNETITNFIKGNKLFLLVVDNFSSYKLTNLRVFKGLHCSSTTFLPFISKRDGTLIFKSNSTNSDYCRIKNCDICGTVIWNIYEEKEQKKCLVVSFELPYPLAFNPNKNRNKYFSEIVPCSEVEDAHQNLPLFKHHNKNMLYEGNKQIDKKRKNLRKSKKQMKVTHYETFLPQSIENCGLHIEKGSLEMSVRLQPKNNYKPLYSARSRQEVLLPRSAKFGSQVRQPLKDGVKQCANYVDRSNHKPLIQKYNENRQYPSPQHFVSQYYNSYSSILFSVVVENHSKYNMIDPKFRHCDDSYNNKIVTNTLRNINAGTTDIAVVHNNEERKGVCGTISWDVQGDSPKKEIQVSFNIPYSGSCSSTPRERNNLYAINIVSDKNIGTNSMVEPYLYRDENCVTTTEEDIRIESKISPLEKTHNGYNGNYCAPVLTLKVFVPFKTDYITYYVPIAASLIIGLVAFILGFIFVRKCKRNKKDFPCYKNKSESSSKKQKCKPMLVSAVTQTDDVEDSNLLVTTKFTTKKIEDPTNDQMELSQVYMSVTSYDMVYMSQTSHDLVKNYRPSVPMPFMNQIKANSCEVITEQKTQELHTVGERGESKCGSENGSI